MLTATNKVTNEVPFSNILVVGLGLMGGSYVAKLKEFTNVNLFILEINQEIIEMATNLGFHKQFISYEELSNYKFDLVIVTCYPTNVVDVFTSLNQSLNNDALVIEISGLKEPFIAEFKAKKFKFNYILTHPMAGLEKKGFIHAKADLFVNANFVYINDQIQADETELEALKLFNQQLGFKSFISLSVSEHDIATTFVSHLPHAIAFATLNTPLLTTNAQNIAASSFKDITRVGNIDINLWSTLLFQNRSHLIEQIETYQDELTTLKQILSANTPELLINYLETAKQKHISIFESENNEH